MERVSIFAKNVTPKSFFHEEYDSFCIAAFGSVRLYGAQNETYIEGWEKKTSNLLIYKRLCKI